VVLGDPRAQRARVVDPRPVRRRAHERLPDAPPPVRLTHVGREHEALPGRRPRLPPEPERTERLRGTLVLPGPEVPPPGHTPAPVRLTETFLTAQRGSLGRAGLAQRGEPDPAERLPVFRGCGRDDHPASMPYLRRLTKLLRTARPVTR